jgi:hypothetical protein
LNKQYASYFDSRRLLNATFAFEKTPSYLALRKVPANIKTILPKTPKILIVLRDPVARAYSHYKMSFGASSKKQFPSFDQEVSDEIRKLRKRGWIHAPHFPYTSTKWNQHDFRIPNQSLKNVPKGYMGMLHRGCYSEQIKYWMEHFSLGENLKIIRYEALKQNTSAVLQDIFDFMGAPPHGIKKERLEKDYSPNIKLKKQQNITYPPLTNETKAYLERFYKPYNDELADLLGEDWRGVWD